MPIENWSETISVVHLADDPQFTEDLDSLFFSLKQKKTGAILDFAGVHYVNSSNIARLLKLRKQMISQDCRMLLCSMSNQVWGVFLITGLDKVFEFGDNVPLALAMMQIGK